MKQETINIGGRLLSLHKPVVMGIVNVTPDSFYAGSRTEGEDAIRRRLRQIVEEGGAIADVGAYSSRPASEDIAPGEEMRRLRPALQICREEFPDLPLSVDTFRADVARFAVEEYGAVIVNDISGGGLDANMFTSVAALGVPYILMHMKGTPQTMQQYCQYEDLVTEVVDYFGIRIRQLREMGVKDIILDPGYGFAKDLAQNYRLMAAQESVSALFELPLLVGLSRKSMIYNLLDTSAEESLNGTSVLNTYALLHGADILRVHDVRAAAEAVRLTEAVKAQSPAGLSSAILHLP